MKYLKNIALTISILCLFSCKQQNDNTVTSVENATENAVKNKTSNREYPKLFCEMLSREVIKEAFPDARDYQYSDISSTLPMCKMTFLTGKKGAGVMLKGQHPAATVDPRKYLENRLKKKKERRQLKNLGDEAYLFPSTNLARVIVMKDGLRYELEYTSQNKTVQEDGERLMRVLLNNLD